MGAGNVTTTAQANAAIDAYFKQFGIQEHIAWFDLLSFAKNGGMQAVKTQGEAACRAAASSLIDAFVFLAGPDAKP